MPRAEMRDAAEPDIDGLLAAVVSGRPAPWPFRADGDGPSGSESSAAAERLFFERGNHHGVLPLVAYTLRQAPPPEAWPTAVLERLTAIGRRAAAAAALAEIELERVLAALADADITALLTKGAALSYSHYAAPSLRPRGDTDLFVAASDRAAVQNVLEGLGYERMSSVSGELVTHQFSMMTRRYETIAHVCDIHWRLFNPQALAAVLGYDEALAASVPLAALGGNARALAPEHALLHACLHRVAHHGHDESDRLIWLYDVLLLVEAMDADTLGRFVRHAVDERVAAACLDALSRCAQVLSLQVAPEIGEALRKAVERGDDVTAPLLGPSRSYADVLIADLRALPGWRQRSKLIAEHLFPDRDYMQTRYRIRHRSLLPLYYLRRLIGGAGKLGRRR